MCSSWWLEAHEWEIFNGLFLASLCTCASQMCGEYEVRCSELFISFPLLLLLLDAADEILWVLVKLRDFNSYQQEVKLEKREVNTD